MLSFFTGLKIYACLEPADLRKSFEGLSSMTNTIINKDPYSGSLFIFTNRRKNRIKLLYWDGTGLWVMMKRLEEGTFFWPRKRDGETSIEMSSESMSLLLDGIDLKQGTLRPWYERKK